MKKSEWSDKQLEELLKQMPKFKDHRDPRDIYQSLTLKNKKQKRQGWLFPSLATAAALFLFFLLAPDLQNSTEESKDYSGDKSESSEMISLSEESKKTEESSKRKSSEEGFRTSDTSNQNLDTANKMSMPYNAKTALYADEVGNRRVITYWIPDSQAQFLVPVSILNNMDEGTWVDLFNKHMADLKEEEWGLSDYYPMKGTLSIDDNSNTAVFNAETDHPYGEGSENETSFLAIIEKVILSNSNLKTVKFTTNNIPGISLGNSGDLTEINVPQTKHAYYSYKPDGQIKPYLVPSIIPYNNIETALEAMKHDVEGYGLKKSIPENIDFVLKVDGDSLIITFSGTTKLLDNDDGLHVLEAILLTAKEFGLSSVKFEGLSFKSINGIDLSSPVKVPLAPNLKELP